MEDGKYKPRYDKLTVMRAIRLVAEEYKMRCVDYDQLSGTSIVDDALSDLEKILKTGKFRGKNVEEMD